MLYMTALSELSTIIKTLQELERMHQLNLELLEQYGVLCNWILETNVPIPNKEKLSSLLGKTQTLLKELYASDSPKFLQYQTSRRKVTEADDRRQGNRTPNLPILGLQLSNIDIFKLRYSAR
jgi:hypothetical protein